MKNDITELVFILDRSGSMHGLEKDTIGGFNSLIARQRQLPGQTWVTTVLFSSRHDLIHDRLPLDRVPELTERDYSTGGSTALLDAVGDTIRHIARIHRYARPEDVPEKTLVVITTDGMENASHRYRPEEVRRLIEHEKEKYGWEFLFLGANIDAVTTAGGLGIGADRCVDFNPDDLGMELSFEAVENVVSSTRMRQAVPPTWSARVSEDHRSRKSKR